MCTVESLLKSKKKNDFKKKKYTERIHLTNS